MISVAAGTFPLSRFTSEGILYRVYVNMKPLWNESTRLPGPMDDTTAPFLKDGDE